MSKCGKGCMPECEYFTTGGCISPFNCMYKEEHGYINSATSGSIIYTEGMNMTNLQRNKENKKMKCGSHTPIVCEYRDLYGNCLSPSDCFFQDPDEYINKANEENLNLKDFVEHYVAHNNVVTLYEENKFERRFSEYKKIWTGMDWQIVCGPGDEDYFKAHPDVEKCPFVNRKVIKVLGAIEGEINTFDSINLCVEDS